MTEVIITEDGGGIGPWARQLAEMNERFARIQNPPPRRFPIDTPPNHLHRSLRRPSQLLQDL